MSNATDEENANMIHPTAIIDPTAKLGANVAIGPYAIIEADVEIGDGCVLQAHAVLRRGTVLGKKVQVDSFAVVAGDPQDFKFDPATPTGVRIGDGAMLREGVTVHRSTKPGGFTTVGTGSLLMGHCHIGHDCQVGNNVAIGNSVLLAGHVVMFDNVFVSGGAGFHQFVRVGEGVMVGGGARIAMDIPHYTLVVERGELYGLNLVGLKRRGFDAATLSELRALYKAVYQGGSLIKRAEEAAPLAKTEAGKKFLSFFVASKRGIHRPPQNVNIDGAAES